MFFRDTAMRANNVNPAAMPAIADSNRTLQSWRKRHCIATNRQTCCVAMARWKQKSTSKVRKGPPQSHSAIFISSGQHATSRNRAGAWRLITHVTLPPPIAGSKQVYLKLRDRASYEFALASAAVVLTISGGNITRARIALGGWVQNHGGRRKRKLH